MKKKRSIAGLMVVLLLAAKTIYAQEGDNDVTVLEEMVVNAPQTGSDTKLARPVTVLSGDELRTKIGSTIGDTLSQEAGITSQSFGAGVGTPVIRGQAGPRVRIMQNGLGNNDVSSLSPDHATGLEPILLERLEVLRGPSTLMFGSGTIGGVINAIDNRIPETLPDKAIGAAGEQRYDSATNESASVLKLEGGAYGLAYHLDGFYRDQGNTHISGAAIDEDAALAASPGLPISTNSNGLVENSMARSRGGSAGLAKIGEDGMVGVSINRLEKKYGIPSDGSGGEPVAVDLGQTKYDFKTAMKRPFALAEEVKMKFGFTDYRHVELDEGMPATTFLNRSYEGRLELAHEPIGIFDGIIGFQSLNSRFAAIGDEALVPRTDLDSYALFAVESVVAGDFNYEFGLRGERQRIAPETGFDRHFTPVSASVSVSWEINDRHRLGLAYMHSERAPQIQELFSDGIHEATHSYETGNPDLKKESGNNLDLHYQYQGDGVSAEFDLFHNWVGDYIYEQRTGVLFDRDTELFTDACGGICIPVYASRQTAAIFKGFEAKTVFSLMQNRYGALDLTLFGDYTRGTFEQGGNVPRMPPLRYGAQLAYEIDDWSGNVRLTRGEAQNNPGEHDSNTPGYLLLNLGTQYRLAGFGESEVLLFAKAKNLLDEPIRNATSYLRNYAPEPGRSAEIGIRLSY